MPDPTPNEVPSPQALRRATVIAVIVAAILFVVAVLPAEYNVDPTGLGKLTGLKEIGEVKEEARMEAREAARVKAGEAGAATAPR